jgi:hypothetical protein
MNNYKSFTIGMLVVPLALLTLGIAVASSVVTPNTFVAGTPAVASQVNANFTAHAAAINDNDTRITGAETALAGLTGATVDGPARAAAHIAADGTVSRFFNSRGGAPTVSHTAGSAIYQVTFPGFTDMETRFYSGTAGGAASGSPEGFVSITPAFGTVDRLYIETRSTANVAGELDFYVVVH